MTAIYLTKEQLRRALEVADRRDTDGTPILPDDYVVCLFVLSGAETKDPVSGYQEFRNPAEQRPLRDDEQVLMLAQCEEDGPEFLEVPDGLGMAVKQSF